MLSLRSLAFVCASFGFVAGSASADRKLVRHPGDGLAQRYLVVLNEPVTPAASPNERAQLAATTNLTIDRLVQRHGANVSHRYYHAVRGFSAQLTDEQAERLAADPSVAFVEQDAQVYGTAIQTQAPWGLDRIDQSALPLNGRYVQLGDATGVTAYVIDSGFRPTHTEFADRVTGTLYVQGRLTDGFDCNGHGTHVAGTIGGKTWGVAKNVELFSVRVLDCNKSGTLDELVQAIDYVAGNHKSPAVANISTTLNATYDVADLAIKNLVAHGVPVVVAAGNDTIDACSRSPARVPEAITVAASDQNDMFASYSNYGACVDIIAPGSGVISAGIASDAATMVFDGTSMAAPHVTGAIAVYLGAHPNATPAEVRAALLGSATTNAVAGVKGSPNLLLNIGFADTEPPSVAVVSPADGAIVPDSFQVFVAADDRNLGGVTLTVDGTIAGVLTAAPFAFQVAAEPGQHLVMATSVDLAGHSSSQTIKVRILGEGEDEGSGGSSDDSDDEDLSTGGCSTSAGAGLLSALAALGLAARRRRARR
ncbi:MAG: S8 family peptidase [Kofleriaceae bacterium]